jgi:hypothetical protein
VRCALGGYQPTSVVLRFDEHNPSKSATVLKFPGFESMDGKTLAPVRMRELSGEIAWLEDAKALVVLALARQLGDCGTWARYALSDDGPKLTAFAAHVSCPENPGQRVNPTPGEPPKSWKTIAIP